MEERIARFISALRGAGVRVSLAESEDAWRGVERMGVTERDLFRWTLRATLIKEAKDIPVFEQLFPLFFGAEELPLQNGSENLSEEERAMLDDTLRQLSRDLQPLLDWLLNGQAPSEQELEELSERAGLQNAFSPAQAQQYARRMQRLLGWQQLEELLEMLWELLAEQGMEPSRIEELRSRAEANKEALEGLLEQYAGQQIGEQLAEERQERRPSAADLMERPFSALSQAEMRILRDEVRRLSARLRSRVSLRQRKGKSGRFDAKSTIRANLRYGGVPLELRFKTRRLKPKLVTLLDVSTSMRPVTEFFLLLLHELQDQVQKTRSYAYVDHLEDVTEDVAGRDVQQALASISIRVPPGHYTTDLGYSLQQFRARHMDALDGRTTVIVLGDARNNNNDPNAETLNEIGRRSRRLLWLNPEYPAQWGTGDSDMLTYMPHCSEVFAVRNLAQLAEAIDRLLSV